MPTTTTDQPTSAPPPTSTPVLIAKLAAEIADAITMDDDRAWRRMYMPGEVH